VLAPALPRDDPLADWITMNWALTADPPQRMPVTVEGWAHLGIGPGRQVDLQSEAVRRGLARAAVDGRRALATRSAAAFDPAVRGRTRIPPMGDASALLGGMHGWHGPSPGDGWRPDVVDGTMVRPLQFDPGRFPPTTGRAGLELAAALAANPAHGPAEFFADADGHERPLHGAAAYRLRFSPHGLPPAGASWSATLYNQDHDLVPGIGGRHSVGTIASDFVADADGGATIAIQPLRPEYPANWLPSPATSQELVLVMRVHDGPGVAATGWRPPAIERREADAAG
jgi:hypothetical protein